MKRCFLFLLLVVVMENAKPQYWQLTGNTGTTPPTNFIGTKDSVVFMIKVFNKRSGYIDVAPTLANTSFGYQTLINSTGTYNTAFGYRSLNKNTTGNDNVALGYQALYSNKSGNDNTANGNQALLSNTTGNNNTATGSAALKSNTTGYGNTANGAGALFSNTTGYSNTANGGNALASNTTGNYNVANGNEALFYNTYGSNLVAVGEGALYHNGVGASQSYEGGANTAIGYNSLFQNTIGYNNTGSGYNALYFNTTGYNNVAYGVQALQSNVSGIGNTAVGAAANVNSDNLSNSTAIGYYAYIVASNQVRIGSIGGIYGSDPTSIGGKVDWSTLSDGRVKKNIKENVPGLAFINKLKPITYNIDNDAINKIVLHPPIKDKDGNDIKPSADEVSAGKAATAIVYTGFVAQDVEKVAKSLNYDFSGVDAAKNDKDLYGLRYSEFVVPLVKAVQELSAANDAKDAKIQEQDKKIDALIAMMQTLQQNYSNCNPCAATTSSNIVFASDASLEQNVPNPFNHTTSISYNLPQKYTTAQIMITDKNGKTLKLVNLPAGRQGVAGAGKGKVDVDASVLSAGAYNYSLLVDGKLVGTKQMVLAK